MCIQKIPTTPSISDMMFIGEEYFRIVAAEMSGSILKAATDEADQHLAGNWCLFPSLMIDCFNLPAHICSAPEPATDGNNAPLPLKVCCSFLWMPHKQSS